MLWARRRSTPPPEPKASAGSRESSAQSSLYAGDSGCNEDIKRLTPTRNLFYNLHVRDPGRTCWAPAAVVRFKAQESERCPGGEGISGWKSSVRDSFAETDQCTSNEAPNVGSRSG
jgi:hypothetical protein